VLAPIIARAMATAASTAKGRRRPRHHPKETEREILEAAERLLRERPFREVTIPEVMRNTGLKRPAFYVHFRDRSELMLRVVEHIGEELFAMADRWLEGEDPIEDARAALDGVAAVYVVNGPVLRALSEAASSDAVLEEAYRALVQAFVDATAEHIRAEQLTGHTPKELDPERTALALVHMNERVLTETLGRHPQDDPAAVAESLLRIWVATLYGASAAR
jgi:TetR/AcrR family transcriptional regulator, ethionamide resistance regulator